MIPSVLSSQLIQGAQDFLTTTFHSTTPAFFGTMKKFVNDEGNLFKGPYISVALPFRKGDSEEQFFPRILDASFSPYYHQELAFKRLSGDKPKPTLVATGPEPEVKNFDNQTDEIEYISKHIKSLQFEDIDSKICIVFRTNKLIKEYQPILEKNSIKTTVLTKDAKDNLGDNSIRLATMHRVKGLDFDHVIIASVNDKIMPLQVSDSSEALIQEEHETKEKSLLFVAATRSKKTLLVTSYGVGVLENLCQFDKIISRIDNERRNTI